MNLEHSLTPENSLIIQVPRDLMLLAQFIVDHFKGLNCRATEYSLPRSIRGQSFHPLSMEYYVCLFVRSSWDQSCKSQFEEICSIKASEIHLPFLLLLIDHWKHFLEI